MIVRDVNPIGDSDSVSLLISDGTHECVAFHHPCTLDLESSLTAPLAALDAENVVRADTNVASIRRIDSSAFGHRIIGVVQSVKNGSALVSVGDILIDDIQLPGDVVVGEFVEFTVNRLDAFA